MGRIKPIAFKSKRWIMRLINSIPNKDITAIFKGIYDGQCFAGTKKRSTRVSFIIPKEIAENNLKFMNEWIFYIIGIKPIYIENGGKQ